MLIIRETICGVQKDGNAVISGQLLSISNISLKTNKYIIQRKNMPYVCMCACFNMYFIFLLNA